MSHRPKSARNEHRNERRPRDGKSANAPLYLYGLHAVEAALRNPQRQVRRLWATPNALLKLEPVLAARQIAAETVTPRDLDRKLGEGAVHQGAVIEAEPLPPAALEDLGDATLVMVLDQVTDPHNVGAILRSAAAFGAGALIMTAHHSPPLSGVLAKAASGGLEVVPVVAVANLARAMAGLGELGFERIRAGFGRRDQPRQRPQRRQDRPGARRGG